MVPLQPFLDSLLSSLSNSPESRTRLENLVRKTLNESNDKSSPENRKNQWEYLLKNEIFNLAVTEGEALKREDSGYYDELKVRLDLVLTFTEQDACEQTFPFIVLQDLLETQTINSCSHIFSWIESHASRLTEGMVPQKGKALILLRTLNDLLRRLSKSGSTTVFCGRILTFLSGVFPLGERSGVNLRGEYGTTWEDVWFPKQGMDDDVQMTDTQDQLNRGEGQELAMQVDSGEDAKKAPTLRAPTDKKEDFYNTFWHLQVPFSKPPTFANKESLPELKDAVNRVLPVIKEATAKERAMMGSRIGAGVGSNKRKRDPESEETNVNEYFFAKFLTSPDLLDLEIADTHFRRQFLFQLVILLHHLLTFTKNAKAVWATPRNRSLQMDFTLEADDAQWVQDNLNKAMDELKQTTPNGRAFAETIQTILEREKNWVKWKNELCAPFDKETWSTTQDEGKVGLFEATRVLREKNKEPREDWPHTLGTEPLTEIWQMGYRDLFDLETPFQPGDVKDFIKKIKLEDNRIEMRKKALAQALEPQAQTSTPTPKAPPPEKNTGERLMNVDASSSATTAQIPAPTPAAPAASLLHPSLPPRPTTVVAAASPPPPVPVPTLTPTPAPPTAPSVKKLGPVDPQISKFEENKQRWAWLALRTARDQYLQHFGKIGTGDVGLLVQEVDKEKQERAAERERLQKADDLMTTVDEANPKTPVPELKTALHSLPHTEYPVEMSTEPTLKKVLVTGGAGYIGSHVIYTLQKTRRYRVISIDNYHNSLPAALGRVSQLSKSELPENATPLERESAEIESFSCDLTKPDQVRAVFEKYGKGGIWGVVHIAAYKAVGESTEIPLAYYENNVSASLFLLQIMNEFDCRRIVYSSSATVYGTPPVIPIPETTRLQADSPYGKTKVMAETMIDDLCHSDSRWRAISLRYFK
ncbi:THO complex subunit 1 [Leucoagaricus sp. SymC.cos]|nr:THO complex subunit 1 [Leucoagaricus sp. SymC.cos]